jgi:23S rRNA (adenine2503-C2)-methyltransferase
MPDGMNVESVWMEEGDRTTICVSTQVGCALGCAFCATAKMGWMRNLDAGEITEQVLNIHRIRQNRATNLVFMGMGEPFLNYDNTLKAAKFLAHQKGLSIAARRITISTAGILPGIERFTDEGHAFRLAISLNAPHQDTRTRIMPVNKKYTLQKLTDAARRYAETARKPLTFEYVLLDGINDSPDDALRLLSVIKGIRCKINLIPYNTTGNEFRRPSPEKIDTFYRTLRGGHRVVNLRWSKGEEVQAACGQLFTESV